MANWWGETLHDGLRIQLRVNKLLHETKSKYQHLMLFENDTMGRVLTLDGIIQTSEHDEFIYHEMLTHTPILAHGIVRSVLIIGGGDGGILRRVLMHQGVKHVVMVEIDVRVIDLCRKYLFSICGNAFEDPRVEVIIGDGARFVARDKHHYDLIIVDSPDPVGIANVLFSKNFYRHCKSRLATGGVIVTQNGVPFFQGSELETTIRHLRSLFMDATCYVAPVPLYVGGFMAFGWASDDVTLREVPVDVLTERFETTGLETRYYTPEVHSASFALPEYIKLLTKLI